MVTKKGSGRQSSVTAAIDVKGSSDRSSHSADQTLWKQTGIREVVIGEIRKLAEKNRLKKVILFGSRARGDYHRASDIDLAVSGGDVDLFRLDVNEETSTLLLFDVVDLDLHLQEELREAIEKDGIILYEKI